MPTEVIESKEIYRGFIALRIRRAEKMRQALDRLRFVSPRLRELADRAKHGDGPPLNEAEKAEMEALRKEFNYAGALLSIRRSHGDERRYWADRGQR
jgi:hypothetical protein